MAFLAAQLATEMLEYTLARTSVPKCIRHLSPQAISQWSKHLHQASEARSPATFFQEARPIRMKLVSITGWNAVVEVRGGLLCYGIRSRDQTDFIEASVFRVRLNCRCFPHPHGPHRSIHSRDLEKRPRRIHLLPFQLQITDFNYETIH